MRVLHVGAGRNSGPLLSGRWCEVFSCSQLSCKCSPFSPQGQKKWVTHHSLEAGPLGNEGEGTGPSTVW